jgi:hypothetical protein
MFIPDQKFFQHGSRNRIFSLPDPGPASKIFSILTPKNGFKALENMIRVVHPGSLKAPDPGSGSATLIMTIPDRKKLHGTLKVSEFNIKHTVLKERDTRT